MGEVMAPLIFMILYMLIIFTVLVISFISSLITTFLSAVVVGAIPLMCGLMKKKKGLGIVGFLISFILFFFHGLILAQLAAGIFVFFILKEKKAD